MEYAPATETERTLVYISFGRPVHMCTPNGATCHDSLHLQFKFAPHVKAQQPGLPSLLCSVNSHGVSELQFTCQYTQQNLNTSGMLGFGVMLMIRKHTSGLLLESLPSASTLLSILVKN